MKLAPVLLVLTAVAFAAAAGTCTWLVSRYASGYSPAQMVLNADIISKMVFLLTPLLTFGAFLLGLIGLFVRSDAPTFRTLLLVIAAGSGGLGLMAGLYGWMNIQTALRSVGPVSFEVVAPSYAETLMALSSGLFGALVALGFHALIARRS